MRPGGPSSRRSSIAAVEAEGQRVIGWRDVPMELDSRIGATARAVAPTVRQLFVAASRQLAADRDAFERKLYVIRRVAENGAGAASSSRASRRARSSTRGC